MSSYMYFELRNKGMVAPLECVSRSSTLYQVFRNYAPYERLRPINITELNEVMYDLKRSLSIYNREIDEYREYQKAVMTSNSSLEEKSEEYFDINNSINDIREEIEEVEIVIRFVETLITIYNTASDEYNYAEEKYKIDPDDYIYFGIESGFYDEEVE